VKFASCIRENSRKRRTYHILAVSVTRGCFITVGYKQRRDDRPSLPVAQTCWIRLQSSFSTRSEGPCKNTNPRQYNRRGFPIRVYLVRTGCSILGEAPAVLGTSDFRFEYARGSWKGRDRASSFIDRADSPDGSKYCCLALLVLERRCTYWSSLFGYAGDEI
jgi:hypothetical protein